MRFATGISIFTTVGLLAYGSVSAAHATDEETPQPPSTESAAPSTSAATHADELSSEKDPPSSPMPDAKAMKCEQAKTDGETVAEQFEEDIPLGNITVEVSGQTAQPLNDPESQVERQRADATGTISNKIPDDQRLIREYTVAVAEPGLALAETIPPVPESSTSEDPSEAPESEGPSPTPTEPTPGSPTPTPPSPSPSPSESNNPEPSESDSPEPTETESPESEGPSPTPTEPAPGSPTPTPSSPAPSTPRPTQPGPSSSDQATGHPQSTPPPSQSDAATTQPSTHEPRNIRQFSDNPRYLLPQLFGTNSQRGSRLIMPRPRSTEQQAPDLETLPPVSEEELDAIKARLSSPDRADQPGGEVNNAEVERRLSHRNTWWVFSGVTGLVGLGAAIWWATTRRQRKH